MPLLIFLLVCEITSPLALIVQTICLFQNSANLEVPYHTSTLFAWLVKRLPLAIKSMIPAVL